MKIYKLEILLNNNHQSYIRLPFVPYGKFLGFVCKDNALEAKFEINDKEVYLKENEVFSWKKDDASEIGIKLVKVDASEEDVFTLYNGVIVPRLGFGTWLVHNDVAPTVVRDAINAGYIHLDSAQAYGNEEGISIAIKDSLFDRKDLFITSKVQAEIKSYEQAKKSIEESLKRLKTDYIDLMLIHCPMPWAEYDLTGGYRYEKENLEVWKAMCEAYQEGKLRSIGVSNFNINDLKNIINNSDIKPMVNQIPIHLGNVWEELINYCREMNIMVESYSPLAHSRLFKDEIRDNVYLSVKDNIKDIPSLKAFDNNLTEAQIYLSYASSYSDIILPKASSMSHILDNMKYLVRLDRSILKKMEEGYKNIK